jgi:hypothetical protein
MTLIRSEKDLRSEKGFAVRAADALTGKGCNGSSVIPRRRLRSSKHRAVIFKSQKQARACPTQAKSSKIAA